MDGNHNCRFTGREFVAYSLYKRYLWEYFIENRKSQAIYGPTYISNLSARKITDIEAIDAENLTIKWNSLDNCVGVNLSYTSQTGEQNQYFVAADELETTLYGAQLGSEFSYITLFRPTENCIDIFETSAPHVMSFPSGYLLDRTGWAATASSDASHKMMEAKQNSFLMIIWIHSGIVAGTLMNHYLIGC